MFSSLYSPEYWLGQAEKIVKRLAEANDLNARETLQRLHKEYVMLARLAEQRRKERMAKSDGL